jgi:hypothetical protein
MRRIGRGEQCSVVSEENGKLVERGGPRVQELKSERGKGEIGKSVGV